MAESGQNWRQKWTARSDLALLSFISFKWDSKYVALLVSSRVVPQMETSCTSAHLVLSWALVQMFVCKEMADYQEVAARSLSLDIVFVIWTVFSPLNDKFPSLNIYYQVVILFPVLLRKSRQLEENFCKLPPLYLPNLWPPCPLILLSLLLPWRNCPCWRSAPSLLEGYCSSNSPLSRIFPLLAWSFPSACKNAVSFPFFFFMRSLDVTTPFSTTAPFILFFSW